MQTKEVIKSTQVLEEGALLAAIEHSLAIIEFDPSGTVLWTNENFAQTMEYKVEEMKNLSHKKFCTKEFVNSRNYDEHWRNLREGKSFQAKIERVTKTGRLIWLEATYTPVTDAHGNVVAVVKIATDITDRENNTFEVAGQLQQMAEDLRNRGDQGMSKSEEVALMTEKLVAESEENLEVFESLKEKTHSIEGIVKTIREIASQTNLLALNAAIEAARAGEHGRGFNVVAGEVRKLSDNVQESIKEVNAHIEGMTAEIKRIAEVTERSQKGFNNSQEIIKQAIEQFSEIGIAARQLDSQAKTFKEMLL